MNKLFFMAGTEGTGEYKVAVVTNRAKVGYRDLGQGRYRLRVEPTNPSANETLAGAFPLEGWKQPGDSGQNRFSTVIYSGETELEQVLTAAVKAVVRFARAVRVNPDAPAYVKAVASDKGVLPAALTADDASEPNAGAGE